MFFHTLQGQAVSMQRFSCSGEPCCSQQGSCASLRTEAAALPGCSSICAVIHAVMGCVQRGTASAVQVDPVAANRAAVHWTSLGMEAIALLGIPQSLLLAMS